MLEATRERERLRRLAPHLVRPMRFVYPIYAGGPVSKWKLDAGLWAYDLLAGIFSVQPASHARRRRRQQAEPRAAHRGLRGAGEYWDCWTDDARLVLETLLSARDEGAVRVSYARVVGFVKEAAASSGCASADRLGGRELTVRARAVVNAAGPWVDAVSAHGRAGPPRLRPTKGVHIVVPRARLGHEAAIVLHAVQDGRVMFVIPWDECSLVGHHGHRPSRTAPRCRRPSSRRTSRTCSRR